MGSLSIQKGKRAERAVASMLNPILDRVCNAVGTDVLRLKRNLSQTQDGGYDLEGLDWIAIEIKHHKVVALNAWWKQTVEQAGTSRLPVLIWKQHGGKWNVRMFGTLTIDPPRRLKVPVDISIDAFLIWFEKYAEVEAKKRVASVP